MGFYMLRRAMKCTAIPSRPPLQRIRSTSTITFFIEQSVHQPGKSPDREQGDIVKRGIELAPV